MFEAGVQGLHPELIKLLGRLRFRTSYGQNVLAHSIEVSRLAAMMAEELGAGAKTAQRAALLHDIGKAVTHEIEGPHALVGGELARKYGESEAVAHAMEAHHNEVEPQTIEAVIVQAADALSGARPGARGESLEQYVKRLRDLEQIATRHKGVDKVYAMQAGREIRVMVAPGAIDDDAATLLSYADRTGDREGARVPGPDQGDGDPRVPRGRVRTLERVGPERAPGSCVGHQCAPARRDTPCDQCSPRRTRRSDGSSCRSLGSGPRRGSARATSAPKSAIERPLPPGISAGSS